MLIDSGTEKSSSRLDNCLCGQLAAPLNCLVLASLSLSLPRIVLVKVSTVNSFTCYYG